MLKIYWGKTKFVVIEPRKRLKQRQKMTLQKWSFLGHNDRARKKREKMCTRDEHTVKSEYTTYLLDWFWRFRLMNIYVYWLDFIQPKKKNIHSITSLYKPIRCSSYFSSSSLFFFCFITISFLFHRRHLWCLFSAKKKRNKLFSSFIVASLSRSHTYSRNPNCLLKLIRSDIGIGFTKTVDLNKKKNQPKKVHIKKRLGEISLWLFICMWFVRKAEHIKTQSIDWFVI